MENKKQCSRRDDWSFHHDGNKWKTNANVRSFSRAAKRWWKIFREERVSVVGVHLGMWLERRAETAFKGECTRPSCDFWRPPECQNYKKPSRCRFGEKCAFVHQQVEGHPSKQPRKKTVKRTCSFLASMLCGSRCGLPLKRNTTTTSKSYSKIAPCAWPMRIGLWMQSLRAQIGWISRLTPPDVGWMILAVTSSTLRAWNWRFCWSHAVTETRISASALIASRLWRIRRRTCVPTTRPNVMSGRRSNALAWWSS